MSTVTLSIGPKSYQVACADGQEAHIKELGAMIAEKYAQLGSARAPLEAQNLLFAALFMADELDQAKKRLNEVHEPAPAQEPVDPEAIAALQNAIAALEADLSAAREAAARPASQSATVPQFDLFGGTPAAEALTDELAARLEALAGKAEASAAALEAAAANA
ncbi:MAG: cell division protein ZapA [Porphyrobacter sp.]|nr:cell division protein ZapA [Porphyrobacter sp.]